MVFIVFRVPGTNLAIFPRVYRDAVRLGEAAVTLFQVAGKPESSMEEQLYESKKTRCAMPHI
jgi:hypothetical protein